MLKLLLLVLLSFQPQATVPALNSSGAATGCSTRATCTYVDNSVPPGPHFYFVVATNALGFSGPSNRIDVTVASGTHNATLNWDPAPNADPTVTYFIYRGAPPTNVTITGVH